MERAARNWTAIRGGQPLAGAHEGRHQSLPAPHVPYFPRPLEERTVIRHKSYSLARQTPAEAVADLEQLDYDFHLFTEKATGQDSVIYRTPDGYRLAQAGSPPGQPGPVDASITISEQPSPRMTPDDAGLLEQRLPGDERGGDGGCVRAGGTAITARSTGSASSCTDRAHRTPSISSAFGFTA
jgi:hypothetical protein